MAFERLRIPGNPVIVKGSVVLPCHLTVSNPFRISLNTDNFNMVSPKTIEEWRYHLLQAKESGRCAIDFKTTGPDPLVDRICIVQIGYQHEYKTFACVADVSMLGRDVINDVVSMIGDLSVKKISHNVKSKLSFLRHDKGQRFSVAELFDTMIASQIVNAGFYKPVLSLKLNKIKKLNPHHSLEELSKAYLGFSLHNTLQTSNWSQNLTIEQIRSAVEVSVLLPLEAILMELIRRNRLEKVAAIEFEVLPAIVEIELSGMGFNAPRARELLKAKLTVRKDLRQQLSSMAKEIGFTPRPRKKTAVAHSAFNPASNFDVLKVLKLMGHTVTDTTDEALQDLVTENRGFARILLEYRRIHKETTFLDSWLKCQHSHDDRIHTSLQQLNPNGTGRFSSRNPNLQQIPGTAQLRNLFTAPQGSKLIDADYSTIELRIMAAVSRDKAMTEALMSGVDLHNKTAAAISGKAIEDIGSKSPERKNAKPVNFGLIYGCGAERLQHMAQYQYHVPMTLREAEHSRNMFFQTYPGVQAFHRRCCKPEKSLVTWHRYSSEGGFSKMVCIGTRTMSGRLRVWPFFEGHTQASFTALANTPVQGTGASIMKRALVRVYDKLMTEGLDDVKIISTIHDQLIVEVPDAKVENVRQLIIEEMVGAGNEFIAPIPVLVEADVVQYLPGK